MKASLFTVLAIIYFCVCVTFGGIRNQTMFKQEYKRAVDSGTDAAAKHTTYLSDGNIGDLSSGFGEGFQDTNNIPVDCEDSLRWFYNVFYRNLGIQDNTNVQEKIKTYIPMKCLITFNKIQIADVNDNWVVDKDFIINHNGKDYLFTLSNQVQDISLGIWLKDTDIGLNKKERQEIIAEFIKNEIEVFLNSRENKESQYYYTFNIGLNDMDQDLKTVSGSNFIVLCEGIPLPAINWFSPAQKLYAFSIGGSETKRIAGD